MSLPASLRAQPQSLIPVLPPCFFAAHLWIRPIDFFDHKSSDWYEDAEHVKYFGKGKPWPKELIKSYFQGMAENNVSPNSPRAWTVLGMIEGKLKIIGQIFLQPNKNGDFNIELAYCMGPAGSGKGYTTTAAKQILNFVKETMNHFKKVVATVHPKNIGSQKVLEKLGFTLVPERCVAQHPTYGAPREFYQLDLAANPTITFNATTASQDYNLPTQATSTSLLANSVPTPSHKKSI